jgi:hypothetical protein
MAVSTNLKPVTALLSLGKMPPADKLQMMEALRADLSRAEARKSPGWHEQVLKERADEENPVDWETAKKQLRARLQ